MQVRLVTAMVAAIAAGSPATAAAQTPPSAPALEDPQVQHCAPYGVTVLWAPAQDDSRVARYTVTIDDLDDPDMPAAVGSVEAPAAQPSRYELFVDGDGAYRLDAGHRHEVAVHAVDDQGTAGEAGRRTFAMPPAPAAPARLRGAFDGAVVRLAWDVPAGACGFEVRREGATVGSTGTGDFTDSAPFHGVSRYSVLTRDRHGATAGATVTVSEPLPAIPSQPTCAWRETPLTSRNREPVSMATLCLLNHERVRHGLQPLHVDGRLTTAAVRHAEDEVARGFFDHDNPDGCDPRCRAAAAGYPGGAGENIYAGIATAAEAVRGWLDSAGHRANILDGGYRTVGSGTAVGGSDGRQWVHVFGGVPAPMSAVSGLEPQFQGAADPTDRNSPADGGSRRDAKLKARRATLSGRVVTLTATLTSVATGRVRVSFRARGRTTSRSFRISGGRARVRLQLPRAQLGFRRATLVVRYPGDARVRPDTVRLYFG